MEQQKFVIEKVTTFSPDIAQAIRDLAQQEGKNYKDLSDGDVKEMIDSPLHFLYLARDAKSNAFVGMVLLMVFRIPYVRKGYIDDLVVDEKFRNKGLGTQLMQQAVDTAREKGAAYVDFTSRPRRDASNNLYEKLGFEKRETNVYRLICDYGEI